MKKVPSFKHKEMVDELEIISSFSASGRAVFYVVSSSAHDLASGGLM
jgi:hypothetical protein